MRLEDFDYYNEEIAQEIYSAMNSTKFLGISVSCLLLDCLHKGWAFRGESSALADV